MSDSEVCDTPEAPPGDIDEASDDSSSFTSDEEEESDAEDEKDSGNEKETRSIVNKLNRKASIKQSSDTKEAFFKTGGALAKASKWKGKAKKPKTSANKLEDQMNFEHLKKLEEIFQEADADGGGGLDVDEFREAMKRTMGSEVDDKELEIIFMKVDTNCDGTVDWDEYLSYMLLEYQEKDTMTSLIREIPFPKKLKEMQSYHRDSVVRITFLQSLTNRHGNKALNRDNPGGRFFSLSKEGQLGIYSVDFELQRSISIDQERESYVGQWLTDMVPLANVGMIAISSTEREITFCDVTANKFEKQFQVTGFKDTILSLDFWFDHENLNNCSLVAGDATGSVVVLKFVEALHKGLFGVYPTKGVLKKIPFVCLMKHKIRGAYGMIFPNVHTNWVNSVRYFVLGQGSECFISCSSTDNDSMYLGDLTSVFYKPKWPGYSRAFSDKSSYFKVRKGILAFDYCKEWNVLVTGSFDGVVRTWSPYSSKPASLIKGHMTPVQHVMIVSSSGQVITGGRDRTIRIIELRDHQTTQILGARSFIRCGPLTHQLQAMFYHGRTKSLWVAAVQVGVLEGYDDTVKEDQMNIKSHDGPVTAALYNHLFNQVVTGGQDAIVSVWDLNTGVKAIQFYTVKGVELTAMTFDPTGRRLITGSRNGAVKIWNFNNGACLRTLEEETMLEVTGIVCMKQKIIAAGWNKIPTVYIDARGDDDDDDPYQWAEVHKDDILCLARYQNTHGTAVVASASYDGDIFIWSVDTGHVLCRINRLESYSPMSLEGHKMTSPAKRRNVEIKLRKSFSDQSSTSMESINQELEIASSNTRRAAIRTSGIILPPLTPSKSDLTGPDILKAEELTKSALDEISRTSTPESVKFNLPEVLAPSSGALRKPMSKVEKIRHHVDIVTGQDDKNYWEAEVSIDKLIFLQDRAHEPQTATLLAAGAMGWVYAWSVHPQGGLLGQFVGAHRDGDTVLSMATDKANKLLVTGDTSGYIKVWEIETYCLKKRKSSRIKNLVAPSFDISEDQLRILSVRRLMKLNLVPPDLSFYYRAHIGSITDITFIDDHNSLLTSCGDGTVRLWTVSGQYIGTFGQKQPWVITKKLFAGKVPADVKRVASANTLKVLHSGHSPWRLARNILNIVSMSTKSHHHEQTPSDTELGENGYHTIYNKLVADEEKETTEDEIEKNYQKCLEKLKSSDVLGKSYKRKRRHRILPKINVKNHLSNFHVHSAIPFSSLEETEVIPIPEILQEKMLRDYGTDTEKKTGKLKSSLPGRRRVGGRSQLSFAGASNRVAKVVKIMRPSR